MAGVNKVILIGNLCKDPEVRTLEGGTQVARFPLATTEYYKDKTGNKVEKTEWHNIVLWRAQAEFAEKYLKKGQSIYLEGKIRTSNYQDKEGVQRYSTEIVADNITMLGAKPSGDGNQAATENQPQTANNFGGNSKNPYGDKLGSKEGSMSFDEEPDELPF